MPSIMQGAPRHKKIEALKPADMHDKSMSEPSGDSSTITSKGDGTYSTDDGMEHPHIGAALMHVAGKHEPSMRHHITSSDGMGSMTSHSSDMGDDGAPEDHSSVEDAKNSMDRFFNEEAGEPEHDSESKMKSMSHSGDY
jgi:hypothetical protein